MLGKWWGGLSLKNKIQIPIQSILLIILVSAQIWTFRGYEESLLKETEIKADMAARALFNSVNALMISGLISDTEQRSNLVKRMASTEGVAEMRIFRNKPVVDQFGPGLPEEHPVDELDRSVLETGSPKTLLVKGVSPSFRMVVPFQAKKDYYGVNCLQCHTVPEGTINGGVSVKFDMKADYDHLQKLERWLWGGQVLLQLVLFFVIGWVLKFVTEPARELKVAMQTMQADGDLSHRVHIRGGDEIGQTAQAFNALVKSFQGIVSQVHGYSGQLSSSASALARDADVIAQSSQDQNETAANTAGAVEEMRVSLTHMADSANQVHVLSEESLHRAESGQQSLQEMMSEIERVEAAVKQMAGSVDAFVKSTHTITSMTQEVRDIAEQTNLLALNAAIEAARAGEQGRGFAVVADEVRKLAEKSASSASEIDVVTRTLGDQSEQVETSIRDGLQSLQSSRSHMETVAKVLSQANESVSSVNAGVDEITEAVNRQKQASVEIARNAEHMAAMIEGNSGAVVNTARAVKALEQLASDLKDSVGRFKV
jgi:methyl-accepting chemotaxis protein